MLAVLMPGTAAAALTLDRSPAVYAPGQAVTVRYAERAPPKLRVRDWRGRTVATHTAVEGKGRWTTPVLPPGYFEVDAGHAAGAQAFAVVPEPGAPSRRWGVATHFAQGWDVDVVPLIARAGIGTVRDEQYWQQVETAPGHYVHPRSYAAYLRALAAAGIQPLTVLSFAHRGYDGGDTPWTDAGRAGFAAYAAHLAQAAGPDVRALEVWNEINGSFCSGPCRQDRAGTYAALLAATTQAVRAVRPDLTVVGGAAVKVPLPWFDALIAHGAARHWDAVAVHPYRADPEGAAAELAALRARLDGAGSAAPVWATEFGTGAGQADAAGRRTTAAYLTRMAVVLRAAGVQRAYWYLLRDYATFTGMGLLRAPDAPAGRYAPTPAYAAYAALIRLTDAATAVTRETTDPRTHVYRFDGGFDGGTGPVRVLWAPADPVRVSLHLPAGAQLYDLVGTPRTLPPGDVDLPLDAAPQFLVGTVTALEEQRSDVLVADLRNATPAARPGTPTLQAPDRWRASACVAQAATAACDWQDLTPRATPWEYAWGDARFAGLRVGIESLHPGRIGPRPVWAARRWCAPRPATLRARGAFSRQQGGDGSGALIRVGTRTLYAATLDGRRAGLASFDVRADLARGECLDFVVTPGPGTDLNFDAVGLDARLTRPRGGA